MNYHSDFQDNKTYNYKTISLDGDKIVQEVNTKYLFGFNQNSQSKVEQFFLDSGYMKHLQKKGITFPESLKEKINDSNCRYILCEVEVISYDTDGIEFGRKTSYKQYDKIQSQKVNKALVTQPKTRSFNVVTEVDNSGNERQVFVPGGIHYNVKPGELKSKHTTFLGCLSQVEVKMVDLLVIV